MKLKLFLSAILILPMIAAAQHITADALLEKAIKHHDPNGNWQTFNGNFTVVMTTPNQPKRISDISINLPERFFKVSAKKDTVTTAYTIDKDKCTMAYNGSVIDSIAAKKQNMSCESAKLYKNYYTYLYGLPMKLNDNGANLSNTVEKKSFKGKEYLVLKVTYDAEVGSDVWYFYFNPKTYAMEVYQFFKTNDKGNEKPDSGEYILLSEEATINGIKIPKIRAWYYNKDDKYLGTDTLIEK